MMMKRLALVACCLLLAAVGCSPDTEPDDTRSPEEKLKALTDAKREELATLLTSHDSKISSYNVQFQEETDLDKRLKTPYVATIEINYPVTTPSGEPKTWIERDVTAYYAYHKQSGRWEFERMEVTENAFIDLQGGEDGLLVKTDEVSKIFAGD